MQHVADIQITFKHFPLINKISITHFLSCNETSHKVCREFDATFVLRIEKFYFQKNTSDVSTLEKVSKFENI